MTKQIPLSKGKAFALVDEEDYDRLIQFKWRLDNKGYAARTIYLGVVDGKYKYGVDKMHRVIMEAKKGQVIDHINRDKLDNRKENLRFCTLAQNQYNYGGRHGISDYKGVTYCKRDKRWIAQLRFGNSRVLNKRFGTEKEAALAYNEAALKYHGEFAFINTIADD